MAKPYAPTMAVPENPPGQNTQNTLEPQFNLLPPPPNTKLQTPQREREAKRFVFGISQIIGREDGVGVEIHHTPPHSDTYIPILIPKRIPADGRPINVIPRWRSPRQAGSSWPCSRRRQELPQSRPVQGPLPLFLRATLFLFNYFPFLERRVYGLLFFDLLCVKVLNSVYLCVRFAWRFEKVRSCVNEPGTLCFFSLSLNGGVSKCRFEAQGEIKLEFCIMCFRFD